MKTVLAISLWGLLLSPLLADEQAGELGSAPPPGAEGDSGTKAAVVPEPNTLVVAGIGSLAILIFTVRRK